MTRFQNVNGDDRKPWDARLVEWMQRGSDKAESSKWTAKQRLAIVLLYLIVAVVLDETFFYVLAGANAIIHLALWQRERKRRATGSPSSRRPSA
jgi:hypothetical protein